MLVAESMLDRSPGAVYPTNRALSASQRWRPKYFESPDMLQAAVGSLDASAADASRFLDTRLAGIEGNSPGTAAPTGDALKTAVEAEIAAHTPQAQDLVVLFRAMSHPDVMLKCGWQHVVALRAVSASLKGWIESGEDAWKTLSACLASDAGLYVPPEIPECSGAVGWKNFFFDHLYPARHKWKLDTERISDHKIRVSVRFKRGVQHDRKLVLPLHQRLKMLKRGDKISAEEARGETGLTVDQVKAQLVHMAGGDLDADMLEMLQDAEKLQHAACRAETDAINLDRKLLDKWDTDCNTTAGTSSNATNHGNPEPGGISGGVVGGGSGGESSAAVSDKTCSEEPNGTRFEARQTGRCRVLQIETSRVVAFVPGVGVRPFHFAHVFDKDAQQERLYKTFAQGAVLSAVNGVNACVLAYGQTASGKTFSLFGPPGWLESLQHRGLDDSHGMVIRSVIEVLEAAQRLRDSGVSRLSVSAQYVQVYREKVTCLTCGHSVTLRAGGSSGSFMAVGAVDTPIDTPGQLVDLLVSGEEQKRYGATAMNDRSSRAHTVLILNLTHLRTSTTEAYSGKGEVVKSQLLLADLAGCEHITKSKVDGDARREAASINSGLLVLKKCISALNQEKSHVPFLESKLTMLLKGALGGSSRTFVLVTGSLDECHADETVEAMRFGEQCSGVTNQTRSQASSVGKALEAIDKALSVCRAGIDSLSSRGKSHLPAFKALQVKYSDLARKRADVAGTE